MVKSHITEKRCSNPGCSFHKQKMVDLSKIDPGSLPSKLKSLLSKEEIKEFFEKHCQVREVVSFWKQPAFAESPLHAVSYMWIINLTWPF